MSRGAIVDRRDDGSNASCEFTTTVGEAFADGGIRGLETAARIAKELGLLHNILAELAGLYVALRELPEGATATIVHDYEGVGVWMGGRWGEKNDTVGWQDRGSRAADDSRAGGRTRAASPKPRRV